MRVLFDVNILISFAIGKRLVTLPEILLTKKITLVYSAELVKEFMEVAVRPRMKKYISRQRIFETIQLIERFGKEYPLKHLGIKTTDTKDIYLLDLCVQSKARFFVTGDTILLDLGQAGNTKIISFTEFTKRVLNY